MFFSGVDDAGVSNYDNATGYTAQLGGGGRAGIIGETPWGNFIKHANGNSDIDVIQRSLERFLASEGIRPYGGNVRGALLDTMWNAGSGPYMQNAIASKLPVVAFVENALPGRGFHRHELPAAIGEAGLVMNGRHTTTFAPAPLRLSGDSTTEFRNLERSLAASATAKEGHPIDIPRLRASVHLAAGYDAAGDSVFGQPVEDFHQLSLSQMAAASERWSADGYFSTRIQGPGQIGARSTTFATPGLAIAGAAAVAYDTATTAHKTTDLLHTGNTTGAQSEFTHFASRNLSMLGGAEVVGSATMLVKEAGARNARADQRRTLFALEAISMLTLMVSECAVHAHAGSGRS